MPSDDGSAESVYSNKSGSNDENMDNLLQRQIKSLKSLQIKTGWSNWLKKERYHHLDQVSPLISDWRGQLPNLREIFCKKEIEFLLTESINYKKVNDGRGQLFIEFVARSGYKDEPDFDENGKPVLRRSTPLHHVAEFLGDRGRDAARELFKIYDRFDVNYIDKSGCTHLHVACRYGFDYVVEKFLELGQNPNCPVDVKGNSPQNFGAVYTQLIKLLPRNKRGDRENSADTLFEMRGKKYQPVQINAQDKQGYAPLYWAAYSRNKKIIELLLRNGADPNLATKDRITVLHVICYRKCDYDLLELFFKICHEINQPVRVNAQEINWCSPLHWASRRGKNSKVIELLMRNGANPYLYNISRETPLQICLRMGYDEMVRTIFKFNGEVNRPIAFPTSVLCVDRPRSRETPMQYAVRNYRPNLVDVLLDLGADLSGFVFPATSSLKLRYLGYSDINFKLRQISALLAIVDIFEKRGYEMKRKDALKIMKLFSFYRGYEKSADVEKSWFDDEEFKSSAKELMIKPSLSLYDLIRLKPEEAAKQVTYKDYYELSYNFFTVSEKHRKVCTRHLCEKMSKRFFRRWALDPILELTRYRLPSVCCEIIIAKLNNDDLWSICLAASGQTSKWRHTVFFTKIAGPHTYYALYAPFET